MLRDLTPDQAALAGAMSEISEVAWCSGWQDGLEHDLWKVLASEGGAYGRKVISADEAKKLRFLSDRCGGWIVYDDEQGEVFVARDEWQRMFDSLPSRK